MTGKFFLNGDVPAGTRKPYERMWAGENRVKAVIAMTHPTAVIIFSLLTLLLVIITQPASLDPSVAVLIVLSMAAAQASIGVFNDVFDWQLDRESKPWRAIPAGFISPREAALIATVLLFLGSLFAALASSEAMILLLILAGVAILYSARLKRTVFSWLPYAIDYPSLPVWVMVALGCYDSLILIIFLLACPFAVAVHICNQLRDYEQDRDLGIRGLVQRLGRQRSIHLCLILLLLSPFPFLVEAIDSPQPLVLMIMVLIGILHWSLTLPLLWKQRGSPAPVSFRALFRRLQISGPLMMVTWYWGFIHVPG